VTSKSTTLTHSPRYAARVTRPWSFGLMLAGVERSNRERKHMRNFTQIMIVASLSLGGLACAGSDVPVAQRADAEASIRAAQEVGAASTPEAALHLKMANDRLSRAQALVAEGENEEAVKLLEEARVDAELAVLLARKEDAQARALEAEQQASKYEQPQGAAKADGSAGAQ
jgi:hypothetical protein